MDGFIRIVEKYGIKTVFMAVVICFLTGIFKIPVKLLAKKCKKYEYEIKRYITLIPIITGFGVAILYTYLTTKTAWDDMTAVYAVSSASLSFSFYAILEKFFTKTPKEISAELADVSDLLQKEKATFSTEFCEPSAEIGITDVQTDAKTDEVQGGEAPVLFVEKGAAASPAESAPAQKPLSERNPLSEREPVAVRKAVLQDTAAARDPIILRGHGNGTDG